MSEAITMKFAKLWFGRELVAAWHSVVLKAQVAHYPHYTRMSKWLVVVGSSDDKAGAAWRHGEEQLVVKRTLWEKMGSKGGCSSW